MKKIILLTLSLLFLAGCSTTAIGIVDGQSFQNVTIQTNDTNPTTKPFSYAVALGEVPNSQIWNKWGYNSDIDSGSDETVWSVGGIFTPLDTASTLDIVSSSNNDIVSSGTGARSVIIYGIDENRNNILEVINMDGTSTVTTSNQYLGINRIATYLVGSNGNNVGDISVTATTGGSNQAEIPANSGTTQQSILFSPTNSTFLVDWIFINVNKVSGGSTPTVILKGYVKSYVSGSTYEIFRTKIDTSIENTIELNPSQPFIIGEKSVLYFIADSDTSNTEVSIRFSGVEVIS